MTTGVERGPHLDREGIRTDRAKWNLSVAALYEEAVKKQEGTIAAEGPLVCRTGQHTGRSPNDKFIVREPSSDANIGWGKLNKAMEQAQWDALHQDFMASLQGKELYVLDCYAGADPGLPPAGADHQRVRLAQSVLPQSLHRRSGRGGRGRARVHGHRSAELQGRSDAARHEHRSGHRAELREEARAHRRHQLRRRDEEVDLQRAELRAAAQERALDALLGQHRHVRRHGALLRPLRHRQDDAVERSRARADRRRRARLERSRRLQLRGRLLREDDQAVGRGRAADLRDDAPVRHRARERRLRPGDARRSTWTTTATPRTRGRRIRFRSSTTPCRQASAATRATSSC